jgi:hypothetical protein
MGPGFDIRKVRWTTGWKDLPEAYYQIKTPGVTAVINEMIPDPEMEKWVLEVGQEKVDEILRNAGYRGTAMHLEHNSKAIIKRTNTSR